MRSPLNLVLPFTAAALLTACGYHLATHGGALPASTRVVAVLPFANHTRQPQLSQAISAAVASEFQRRAHYRVQAEGVGADVAVHGDLLSAEINPVTFDATTGRATTAEVVLHLQVWVVAEPDGRELFRSNDMVFHDQYEISTQQATFFEEDSTALLRLSQTVAQTVVADILEAF